MTTAIFKQDGNEYDISITGHADYGKPDIVCAACSALACTLMQCVLSEAAHGALHPLSVQENSGDVRIRFSSDAERVNTIVDTITQGFALLAHTYPDHVKLVA